MNTTYYAVQITEEETQTVKQLFDYTSYEAALSAMYAFMQNVLAYKDTVKKALCLIITIDGNIVREERWIRPYVEPNEP